MSQLYIKQKVFSLGERFTVFDEAQQPRYHVDGSFMRIPKSFTVSDAQGHEVATVTKQTFSWLPRFHVSVEGQEVATIRKEFSWFKPRYALDGVGVSVQGDWWDMSFAVLRGAEPVARIQRKLLTWGDTYEVEVHDESLETVVVSLVVAIDRVRAEESSSSAAAASSV